MSCLDQIKQKLSDQFKVTQLGQKLFINDKYIIQISVLDKNNIIVCDTIFCNKKYTTYLVSVEESISPKIPDWIINKIISHLEASQSSVLG